MFNDLMLRLTMGRVVILGFLFAAIYYFMMYDSGAAQENQINSLVADRANIQTQIDDIQKKIDMARNFEKASQNLGDSLQKLLSYIPAHFRIGQLLKMVSREARLSGLDIIRMGQLTVTDPNRIPDFTELGTAVEMTGQYDQVLAFMSAMTRQRQIFLFEKIAISVNGEVGKEAGVVKFAADIHAFSYNGTLTTAPTGNSNEQQ